MRYKNRQLDTWLSILTECVDIDGKIGFAIAHNYRVIRDALQEYTTKKRKLIAKYGEVREDGSSAIISPDKIEEANKELNKYADLEVSVDIMKLPEDEFDNSPLSARKIINLEWMMDFTKKSEPIPDDQFGLD